MPPSRSTSDLRRPPSSPRRKLVPVASSPQGHPSGVGNSAEEGLHRQSGKARACSSLRLPAQGPGADPEDRAHPAAHRGVEYSRQEGATGASVCANGPEPLSKTVGEPVKPRCRAWSSVETTVSEMVAFTPVSATAGFISAAAGPCGQSGTGSSSIFMSTGGTYRPSGVCRRSLCSGATLGASPQSGRCGSCLGRTRLVHVSLRPRSRKVAGARNVRTSGRAHRRSPKRRCIQGRLRGRTRRAWCPHRRQHPDFA